MEGIPYWEVQQMDELTVKVGNPIFNYTIYWKVIAFEGTWRASLIESNTKSDLLNKKGDFG